MQIGVVRITMCVFRQDNLPYNRLRWRFRATFYVCRTTKRWGKILLFSSCGATRGYR